MVTSFTRAFFETVGLRHRVHGVVGDQHGDPVEVGEVPGQLALYLVGRFQGFSFSCSRSRAA